MTHGRSGSTSLMESLQRDPDIALPSRDIDCEADELVLPEYVEKYMQQYAALCGHPIDSPNALIDAFFKLHEKNAYTGFKSMPNRHPDFSAFVSRPDIRFISLIRSDVSSTVASFLVAFERSTWRRHGEAHPEKWRFDRKKHGKRAQANFAYLIRSHAALNSMPNAIRLTYEELVEPGFSNPELDAFFGREIRIADPRPPTHGSTYVENWNELVAFLQETSEQMRKAVKAKTSAAQPAAVESTKVASSTIDAIQNDVERYLEFVERLQAEAARSADVYRHVKTYCMFIGYPRSGHSIVGSLLDAHPNMVVAQELDALRCFSAGMNRQMVFHLLLENSRRFTQLGRVWNGYNYQVPNQWQGRYQNLEVIGDKKGGRSSIQLLHNPQLLDHYRRALGLPIRFVHVIRNPYDNIATFSIKHEVSLDAAVKTYFQLVKSVMQVKQRVPEGEVFDLRHEDLIVDPAGRLAALCRFLGQEPDADYLKDCASIIYASPHRSRHDVEWPAYLLKLVQERIGGVPFLQGYDFES